MEQTVYSQTGSAVRSVTLPEAVFAVRWNPDLVHEVVVGIQGNARAGTAHTKDRSEVAGGGKKPWRQKGTGRARHGSRRSPIWTGGGVTFGPRNTTDHTVKLNRKAKAKALASVLAKKQTDGEIILVESLTREEPKAKEAKAALSAIAAAAQVTQLATKRKNAALIVLPARDIAVEKSFRNFGNVEVAQAKDVNPVDLLTYKFVVITEPEQSLEILATRVSPVVATPVKSA